MVEWLKVQALNLNPITEKKKKRKKVIQIGKEDIEIKEVKPPTF
jgi:hypothetical protein